MFKLLPLWLCVLFPLIAVATTMPSNRRLIGSNTDCPQNGPRIRKAWKNMLDEERSLYLAAVETAMEVGYHGKMVWIHLETRSELEAHDTCGFVLWHRRFLLAYENMLRSLTKDGLDFRCVTLPYWNIMDDFNAQHDGDCGNFLECSTILTGIGGTPGDSATRQYNGVSRTGLCQTQVPYANYADENGEMGCMPRSNVQGKDVPTGASYSGLFNMITGLEDYESFTDRLQRGIHNEVHAAVGGTMSS